MMRYIPVHSILKNQKGFSYVEVMVASVLIAATLVPMLQALQSGVRVADSHQSITTDHYQLNSKMETVLSEPFSKLLNAAELSTNKKTPSLYSDANGTPSRRLVFLSFYDVNNVDGDNDPFTIADADTDGDNNPYTGSDVDISLLWVRVEIEKSVQALETLKGR